MQAAGDLIGRFVTYILNPIILVIFAAGFFLFMWGLVKFMWSLNSGRPSEDGQQHMLWGIVGMVIMVSVEGIIYMIDSTFQLQALSGGGPDLGRIQNINPPANFFGK
jgi:ABC-type phosphate transport system permease subunit